uniref:T9SS type A sorting domain-containing protein n=3 Tax=Tenacibaculum TaxID=104267 RepID=UPI00261D26F5
TDWTDNCAAGGVGIQSDGGVDQPDSADGCTQYRLYTFTITDDCGNSDTETTLVSRDYDMTNPVITDLPESLELCDGQLPEMLTAKWTDNCAAGGDLVAYPTNYREESCIQYADYVFTATDDCGNSVTETVTMSNKTDLFENCETAFARGDNYTCFLDDGFNRWGWTNYFAEEGTYTLPLYSGAAQCDVSKGVQSGEVTVTYLDGYVTVEYNLFEGYVMSVAHVYIGCEKYPTKNGKETVAPGQFNFNTSKLDYASNYTVGPIEASGPIYVIAHAEVCEEVCRCHESVDDGGTFTPSGSVEPCNEEVLEPVQQEPLSFSAYPVPFENELTLEYNYKFDTDVAIEIYSMNGILIKRVENNSYIKGTSEQIKIDLSDVQNQTLIVRMITNKGVVNKKIIAMRPKKKK